jgi:hypothetical protein
MNNDTDTITLLAAELIAERDTIHPAHALNRLKAAERIVNDLNLRVETLDEESLSRVAAEFGVSFDTVMLAVTMVNIRQAFLDM